MFIVTLQFTLPFQQCGRKKYYKKVYGDMSSHYDFLHVLSALIFISHFALLIFLFFCIYSKLKLKMRNIFRN